MKGRTVTAMMDMHMGMYGMRMCFGAPFSDTSFRQKLRPAV